MGVGWGTWPNRFVFNWKLEIFWKKALSLWVGLGGSRGNCSEKGFVGQKLREGMLGGGGRVGAGSADWAKSWTLSVSANLSCDWGQKLSSAVRANGQKLDRAPAPAAAAGAGAQPILCHFFFFIRIFFASFAPISNDTTKVEWHNLTIKFPAEQGYWQEWDLYVTCTDHFVRQKICCPKRRV